MRQNLPDSFKIGSIISFSLKKLPRNMILSREVPENLSITDKILLSYSYKNKWNGEILSLNLDDGNRLFIIKNYIGRNAGKLDILFDVVDNHKYEVITTSLMINGKEVFKDE